MIELVNFELMVFGSQGDSMSKNHSRVNQLTMGTDVITIQTLKVILFRTMDQWLFIWNPFPSYLLRTLVFMLKVRKGATHSLPND